MIFQEHGPSTVASDGAGLDKRTSTKLCYLYIVLIQLTKSGGRTEYLKYGVDNENIQPRRIRSDILHRPHGQYKAKPNTSGIYL